MPFGIRRKPLAFEKNSIPIILPKSRGLSLVQNIRKYLLPLLLIAALVVSLLRPDVANLNSIASKIQDDLQGKRGAF